MSHISSSTRRGVVRMRRLMAAMLAGGTGGAPLAFAPTQPALPGITPVRYIRATATGADETTHLVGLELLYRF